MATNRIFTKTAKFFDLLRNRQDLFFADILSAAFLSLIHICLWNCRRILQAKNFECGLPMKVFPDEIALTKIRSALEDFNEWREGKVKMKTTK